MERITWHFPTAMSSKKLTHELEEQIFYQLATEFSDLLNRNVRINNDLPIRFEDRSSTNVFYQAKQFQLTILLNKESYLFDYPEPIIKICWFTVQPQNQGLGTKLMKHFLRTLSETSYERVILDTRDDEGRRFWRRLGFNPSSENWHLNWFLKIPH
ncbi:GNAT family N-acetyltransferase [Paenibacillus chondroitinus]|uniref:GNAT family N-acetyltransferase n=1 Tax=Paenibacillus chondroitinus TaxID=59842 RepID=A0ABU6DIL4_9BACL|nr:MULTISPECIES: GNAT family N-acetyltransferase [Paenibacillus]MCY9658498.1 GNAT family N-acetyltransferase [Paenibacillus anseongense]MEB4797210.1 GNAT family N-acetyltransferase [Paenibacillus chondroitinus]